MSLQQLRNVNFGRSKLDATGSSGVGYQLLDSAGSTISLRTTTGVYQTAPGIYSAYVSFPDNFRGQILWDTGTAFVTTYYASEAYNVEENNPHVDDIYAQTTYISGAVSNISSSNSSIQNSINGVITTLNVVSGNIDVIGSQMNHVSGTISQISGSISSLESKTDSLVDIQYGRWFINNNQMIFYKEDNVTEVVRFNLFDENGNPTMDAVFDRVKV